VSDQPIKVYPNDADDPSRNPHTVVALAAKRWCDWHPGDGSRYRVHIETIRGGSDDADRVLLLNIQRRTIAFQWAPALYRHLEGERWTKKRCKELGIPEWAWRAARPLLDAVGATRKNSAPGNPYASIHSDTWLARPVTTVHLPDTEEPA
jgi:hypothetical protein